MTATLQLKNGVRDMIPRFAASYAYLTAYFYLFHSLYWLLDRFNNKILMIVILSINIIICSSMLINLGSDEYETLPVELIRYQLAWTIKMVLVLLIKNT